MTRFARAKGSKSSNERLPNEATPWCVMKQQLADNSTMKDNRPEKTKSAKELLSVKDDPFYYDTTGNVNTDWAEFEPRGGPEQAAKIKVRSNNTPACKKIKRKLESTPAGNENSSVQNSNDNSTCPKKKSKKQKHNAQAQESSTAYVVENGAEVEVAHETNQEPAKKAKKKNNKINCSVVPVVENTTKVESVHEINQEPVKKEKKKSKINSAASPVVENTTSLESNLNTDVKPAKKKKKRKDKKIDSSAAEIGAAVTEPSDAKQSNTEKKSSLIISKRHKRNQKRIEKNAIIAAAAASVDKTTGETPLSGGFNAAGNDWSSNVNFGKRRKFEIEENNDENRGVNGNANDFKRPPICRNGEVNNGIKRKAPKIRDDKEHKRRKPDNSSIKCVINGMEIEIVKFEGFPVKKEDAERLKDLRKQMVMKGIPKSEIDGAMKLERRRAEKSLARVRKQVCFHCRKAGHNLSDCPELGEEESATGICFKCGSTEHTHFECKVTKKDEFRFASCFICREQGHIAKQCPDNPKGLYPQGGSCKICGDVTHLRKDCPDLTQDKEESIVTLTTITESTLESLDEDVTKKVAVDDSKNARGKIVKF